MPEYQAVNAEARIEGGEMRFFVTDAELRATVLREVNKILDDRAKTSSGWDSAKLEAQYYTLETVINIADLAKDLLFKKGYTPGEALASAKAFHDKITEMVPKL